MAESGGSSGRTFLQGAAVLALLVVSTVIIAAGSALAHSGHADDHAAGGIPLAPVALLLGSVSVIGASGYVETREEAGGPLARAGVLLGVLGLLLGVLLLI